MASTSIDTLICAEWIIPIQPTNTVLTHHSLAIHKGEIIDILPTEQACSRYQATQHLQLSEHVLMPGLINAHGHGAMTLFRGMVDDQPLKTWLNQHIWPAEGQWVNHDFVRDGSELAIVEMLRSGTTCFSDMYFYPDITAKIASQAGMRAQITFPIFDFPSVWGQDADDYIRKGLNVRDDFKHSELIDLVFGPHAPYTVSDAPLKRIAMLAAELDTAIQIHVHETQQEVDDAIAQTGKRPLSRLNDLDILSPRTQLVHMTALNNEDLALVEQSGSHIIHCPQSNLKLASGFCPVQKLLDRGINVALGTDGAASNNSLNMFAEIHTAALLAKAVSNNAAALKDWQALEMATLGGAKALAIDTKVGTLERGKRADVIAIDCSHIEQQPLYNPLSQLVYTHCAQHVSYSWIDGNLVLQKRNPVNLDIQAVRSKAQGWQRKIRSS